MAYKKVITQAGEVFFDQARKRGFKVVVDDVLLSESKIDLTTNTAISDLANPITEPISQLDYIDGYYCPIINVTNDNVSNSFTCNTIGVVGHLSGTTQQLLFVISDDDPLVIPPSSSGSFTKNIVMKMDLPVTWSGRTINRPDTSNNSSDNNQHIDLSNYVSQQQLANTISDNDNSLASTYVTRSYSDSLEAINASKATSYTDSAISNAITNLPKPSAPNVDLTGYVKESALSSYAKTDDVNSAYQNAVNTAKSYTDSLNSSAMVGQNNYIGWVYGATISSANSYTDSKIASLQSLVNSLKKE